MIALAELGHLPDFALCCRFREISLGDIIALSGHAMTGCLTKKIDDHTVYFVSSYPKCVSASYFWV